jgi:hypothetical protein
LTPSLQAVDYSFGERTLQPQFISKRQFLASTPVTDVYLRELNALAKQRAGDAAGAQAIRDASILSVVSAKSTASARLAQDASQGEPSGVASDEPLLAVGESTPAAPETAAPGGEGEATVPPVPAAALPVRATAAGRVAPPARGATELAWPSYTAKRASQAVPTIATGSASASKVAPVHADPPRAASSVGTESLDVRRPVTSASSAGLQPNVVGFLATAGATRHESAGTAAFPASDRARAIRPRASSNRGTPLQEMDDTRAAAQLVDLVFADAAWLDGPAT